MECISYTEEINNIVYKATLELTLKQTSLH